MHLHGGAWPLLMAALVIRQPPQGEPAATTTPLDSPIHGAAQGRGIFLRRVTPTPVRVALS